METYDEKRSSEAGETSTDFRQLRQDAEHSAMSLAHCEKRLIETSLASHGSTRTNQQLCQLLRYLADAPASLLRKLNRKLHALIQKQLARLLEYGWKIPRFLVGDVIRFEDALGRKSNLPYQHFKHWACLKSYLQHAFHGLPGDYQIQRNKFLLSLSRSGKLVSANVWEGFVEPGDCVTMSVYTTTPLRAIKGEVCPACGYRLSKSESKAEMGKCRQGHGGYDTSERALRRHIKPCDGGLSKLNVLIQKHETSFRNRPNYLCTRISANTTAQDPVSNVSGLEKCDLELVANPGIAELKNVSVYPTHEPLEIIDAIEDLMAQITTLYPGSELVSYNQLRESIRALRHELQSRHELNFLAFEGEHTEFMAHARAIFHHLHSTIDKAKSGTAAPVPIGNVDRSFTRWVEQHFPESSDTVNSAPDTVLVMVKGLACRLECFRVTPGLSIRELKFAYAARNGLPTHMQYLVYNGKKLEDRYTIGDCGITSQYYVHVLLPIWRPHESN